MDLDERIGVAWRLLKHWKEEMEAKPFDKLLDTDSARADAREDIEASLPVFRDVIAEATCPAGRAIGVNRG